MITLVYFWFTLNLSPRAAAIKNKIRRAEKAFMSYIIRIKKVKIRRVRCQIFLSCFMGFDSFFVEDIFDTKFNI